MCKLRIRKTGVAAELPSKSDGWGDGGMMMMWAQSKTKTSRDGLERSDVEGQEKMLPQLPGKEFSFVLLFVLLGSYWGMPAGESKSSLLSLLSEMLVFLSNTSPETLQFFLFELFCLRWGLAVSQVGLELWAPYLAFIINISWATLVFPNPVELTVKY